MNRLDRLRERMREQGWTAALVRRPVNVGYLSGFTGTTAALLITPSEARFITGGRYAAQAGRECPGWELGLTQVGGSYEERIAAEGKTLGIERLAVEGDWMTVQQFRDLEEQLPGVALEAVKE